MFRIISIFILLISFVEAKKVIDRVIYTNLSPNKFKIRIYFNYLDPFKKVANLTGSVYNYQMKGLPIANGWFVTKAKVHLIYSSSISLNKNRSSIRVSLNDMLLAQGELKGGINKKIDVDIPAKLFDEYNNLKIGVIQHYHLDKTCEDNQAPELWTKLNLQKSYIELEVLRKVIPEEIASFGYIFDKKSVLPQKINIVVPKNINDNDLYNYFLFASIVGIKVQYRDFTFYVSHNLKPQMNNLIIGSPSFAKSILSQNFPNQNVDKKILGDINIIQNPDNPVFAIVVIQGNSSQKISNILYGLTSLDFPFYKSSFVNILNTQIPEKSQPYSAPLFFEQDKTYTFKEIGYLTQTFEGMYPPELVLRFKMYPDLYFTPKERAKLYLNILAPNTIRKDSVINIKVNNSFAHQINILNDTKFQYRDVAFLNAFEDNKIKSNIPMYLFYRGNNVVGIQTSLVPLKQNACEIFNMQNLKLTIMDDSEIYIPKAKHWIKMPYLEYFSTAVYPYSIYPDLQDTGILVTDKDVNTISALMTLGYFIGTNIKYPPYRVTVTTHKQKIEDKNIMVIGNLKSYPVEFLHNKNLFIKKDGTIRFNYPLIKKRHDIQKFYLYDEDKDKREYLERKKQLINVTENIVSSSLDKYLASASDLQNSYNDLIIQMFQSPFNSQKTVVSFMSGDSETLRDSMKVILSNKMLYYLNDAVSVLDMRNEAVYSLPTTETYYIGNFGFVDRVKFYFSINPYIFLIITAIVMLVFVFFLRILILKFRNRKHPKEEDKPYSEQKD